MTRFIDRVFPERNREALEGSPERTALETGERIETTYGHVVTKMLEILTANQDDFQGTLQEIRKKFPQDMDCEVIPFGGEHMVIMQMNRILETLHMDPVAEQQHECLLALRSDMEPLVAEVLAAPDQCIDIRRFCSWLSKTAFLDIGILNDTQQKEVLSDYIFWIGRGYLMRELEAEGFSKETMSDPLHVSDVEKFADAMATWKFQSERSKSGQEVSKLRMQLEGLVRITEDVRRQLETKYPIKE